MVGFRRWLLLLTTFVAGPSSSLRADGGTLCALEKVGGYRVAVFTSPVPLRAGPVDVSVLVQDAATGEQVPEARVTVRLTPRSGDTWSVEGEATSEAATNKLFHAALLELPDAGRWEVEVSVDGPRGPAVVRCEVEAGEPLPRWREEWPWIGWPAFAILLFCAHQLLVRRRARARGERHA